MKPIDRVLLGMFAAAILLLFSQPVYAGGCSATPAADWKTTLDTPNDPFFVTSAYNPDEPRWVKFTILLCDPTTVYFHNGWTYRFHYDFARARLDPFRSMTRQQFDQATLHTTGQQAVLGAVLVPGLSLFGGGNPAREAAIQLVRQDAYSREQVRDWFNLVKSKLTQDGAPLPWPVFYFPTHEQQPSAETHRAWLATQGIQVGGIERWITRNACYAHGWAIGTMKFIPGSEVAAAYRAGTLRPADILLTDSVPADTPPVAGIVSLAPATPSSHTALLSQTWGIPFAYMTDAAAAHALVGRRVIVRSYSMHGICTADLIDAHDLPQSVIDDLLTMKQVPPLQHPPIQPMTGYTTGLDTLTPADTGRVGGKAANYGVLRRAIPASTRPGLAIGFNLWNEFLAQPLINGRTLRQEIDTRLAPFTDWPPADPAALSTALSGVRGLFTNTSLTRFTAAQEAAILAALQAPLPGSGEFFDPDVKIRFRSSSNVEDTATFTGAGLYNSFSGCLRDDIDADNNGPSACDPTDANERGVFRAIRRVFASFYNDNAYQARRRLSVDEHAVGMAVLCHHSFPDPTELANGVVIVEVNATGGREVRVVTQLGATSVTNPEDGSTPEEVLIYNFGQTYYPDLQRSSSRVLLGQTVMTWESDYTTLASLVHAVTTRYITENQPVGRFALDFEFKKTTVSTGPAGLEIKQVRPLPLPATAPSITPVLVNSPQRWCLFQGETSNILSNHRLKVEFLLGSQSLRLDAPALSAGFLGDSVLRFNTGCRVRTLAGRPDAWPAPLFGPRWTFANNTATQRWRISDVDNPRTYTLRIESVPTLVSPAVSPVVRLTDFGFFGRHLIGLEAHYDRPVPIVDWTGQIIQATSESVALCPCPDPDGILINRVVEVGNVTIDTAFRWVPGGAAAGYTFDLASWDRTIITGLISRPITLRSHWSQTYRPEHHNFDENFVFDPRLEPGIAPVILQELAQRGIAYILLTNIGSLSPRLTFFADTCLPCPADWDASGTLGVEDLFRFLAAWFALDPRADWDGSGDLGVQDLFDFLAAYFAGCP